MANINPGTQIGNYIIVRSLEDGLGGMAQVYQARLAGEELR
jgi:hypothetical protein